MSAGEQQVVGAITSDRNAEVPQAQHRLASEFGKHRASRLGNGAIGRWIEGFGVVHSGLSQSGSGGLFEIQSLGHAEVQVPTADRNGLTEGNVPSSENQQHGATLPNIEDGAAAIGIDIAAESAAEQPRDTGEVRIDGDGAQTGSEHRIEPRLHTAPVGSNDEYLLAAFAAGSHPVALEGFTGDPETLCGFPSNGLIEFRIWHVRKFGQLRPDLTSRHADCAAATGETSGHESRAKRFAE